MKISKDKSGFTLVELLVVIAIITILATFLVPSIGRGRDRARRAKCLNNVRVMTTEALLQTEDYQGNFLGYPATLGALFSGNLDIDAADCPAGPNKPSNDGAGGALSDGEYTLVVHASVVQGTAPIIYSDVGMWPDGVNAGFVAGNVKFVEGAPPDAQGGTVQASSD